MPKVQFSVKRIKRGLCKLKDVSVLNADINGAVNIGRKYNDYIYPKDLNTGYLYQNAKAVTYTDILPKNKKKKRKVVPV